MATDVGICNVALGYLGDEATVVSIDPPEGSAQAEHCAMFYPMARDELLEMHDWGFATKRVAMSLLATAPVGAQWAYAYAVPNDLLNTIAVLDINATNDYSAPVVYSSAWQETPMPQAGVYTPQPFELESLDDGTDVIYTSQASAMLRYVARVLDPARFSPLFTATLCASLASKLAGPLLKGEAGIAAALRWQKIAFGETGNGGLFAKAAASDAQQKRSDSRSRQQVSWIAAR